ncbi:NAD(P)H-binding protein [Streptomyces sp. WSLK1-3]|uniref:NAD(P)H-binding protein n=1 Tax=Streptomyces sp. WSLK1-3 TaxID=3375475 RepID=UPI0037BAE11E
MNVSNLKAGYDDHQGVDQGVRASDTDWTLASAVTLSKKPADDPLRAAEAGTDKPGMRISRAELADFLLDTVEQELASCARSTRIRSGRPRWCGLCWSSRTRKLPDGPSSPPPDRRRGHRQVASLNPGSARPSSTCSPSAATSSRSRLRETEVESVMPGLWDER